MHGHVGTLGNACTWPDLLGHHVHSGLLVSFSVYISLSLTLLCVYISLDDVSFLKIHLMNSQ